MKEIKNIIWDFDGVIIDSLPVREKGFEDSLETIVNKEAAQELIQYHRENGGKSRYQKFHHLYKNILQLDIEDSVIAGYVDLLADKYSKIVKSKLCNPALLIGETNRFIKDHYHEYNMHIISGSADIELKYICKALGLERYMLSINGSYPSPTHGKTQRVHELMEVFEMDREETVMIGDSINDYHAFVVNSIEHFIGYNSERLKDIIEKENNPKIRYFERFPVNI
jgi:phosphoglycolate phosphatase-like HAD superfamily hydrolase